MGFAITDDLTKKAIPADKLGPQIVHTIEFTFISAEPEAEKKIREALAKGTLSLSDSTPAAALNELSAIAPAPAVVKTASTPSSVQSDNAWRRLTRTVQVKGNRSELNLILDEIDSENKLDRFKETGTAKLDTSQALLSYFEKNGVPTHLAK